MRSILIGRLDLRLLYGLELREMELRGFASGGDPRHYRAQ